MVEFQESRKIKKTRKDHKCIICYRKIPKGFSCWHITGKAEGEFFSNRLCNTCYELQRDFPDYVCDFNEGYFDSDTFIDSCSELGVATPLQLLNKLNENYNKNLDKLN